MTEDIGIQEEAGGVTSSPGGVEFGISRSALLAPVVPQMRKKRKTQDEFTIAQKLDILKELQGPDAMSVPNLAEKHNTSRASIYRWKNDMPRLLELCQNEGKGESKRVRNKGENSNKRKAKVEAKVEVEEKVVVAEDKSPKKRKPNKGESREYTAAEKLAVVMQLKGENPPSIQTLAERCNANQRTIYRWKKDEERLKKLVAADGKGGCKRVGIDPLFRIKEGLKLFHDANRPADGYLSQPGQPVLTGTMLAAKAKQLRDEMLAQHQLTPFLTPEEVKGMNEFRASTSWGQKLLRKLGGKVDDAPDVKGTDAAATNAGTADLDINNLPFPSRPLSTKTKKQKSPPKAASPSAAAQKKEQKATDMKKELASMKKNLTKAEKRAENLKAENASLKAQIANLTTGGVEGGSGNDCNDAMTVDSALEAASVGGEGDAEENALQIEI